MSNNDYLNGAQSPDGLEAEQPHAGRRVKKELIWLAYLVVAVFGTAMLLLVITSAPSPDPQTKGERKDGKITPPDTAWLDDVEKNYGAGQIGAAGKDVKPDTGDLDDGNRAQILIAENELARIQRGNQYREDLFYDAVVSNTAVQNAATGDGQAQGGGGSPPALGPGAAATPRPTALQLPAAGPGIGPQDDPNLRGRKDFFKRTERHYGHSTEIRRPQLTPFELRAGSMIPAVMISGINSALPGEVIAQVSQNVRDTRTGQHVLIPQDSNCLASTTATSRLDKSGSWLPGTGFSSRTARPWS